MQIQQGGRVEGKLICHGINLHWIRRGLTVVRTTEQGGTEDKDMGEDRRRKKNHKEQYAYMEQLKNYQNQGVPIYIDGRITQQEKEWFKIFEIREDGAVYMADYVNTDDGQLTEIHFDLVYLDLDAHQAWENQKRLDEMVRKAQLEHYKALLKGCRRPR